MLGKAPLSRFISPHTSAMATFFLQTHRWACGQGLANQSIPPPRDRFKEGPMPQSEPMSLKSQTFL